MLVVGAGPAGLQAAIAAAGAGHQVTVVERDALPGDRCGWRRRYRTGPSSATSMRNQVNEARRLGVTIEYGVEATPEVIAERSPDRVILATGAVAQRPWWVGGDVMNVADVRDVLTGAASPPATSS